MTKVVDRVPITPSPSCGTERFITVHRYGPSDETVEKCYIQASLHSDEVPAMLVAHKLIKMLDACDQRGEILKRVIAESVIGSTPDFALSRKKGITDPRDPITLP